MSASKPLIACCAPLIVLSEAPVTLLYILANPPAKPKPKSSPPAPWAVARATSLTILSLGSNVCAIAAPAPPPIPAPVTPANIFCLFLLRFNKGLAILATLAAITPVATSEPPPVKGAAATPAIPPAIDKPTSVTILMNPGLAKKLSVSLLYLPFCASDKTSSGLIISFISSSKLKPFDPSAFLAPNTESIANCSLGVGSLPFILNVSPCTTISDIIFLSYH